MSISGNLLRKILSIVLVIAILLTTVGCSGSPPNPVLSDPNGETLVEKTQTENVITENTLTEFITSEIYLEEFILAENKVTEVLLEEEMINEDRVMTKMILNISNVRVLFLSIGSFSFEIRKNFFITALLLKCFC